MKRFCLLVLLLAGWSAHAQGSLTTAQPPAADTARLRPATAATTDTAVAIHRLFAAKRGVRAAIVIGTGLMYVLAVVAGPDKYGSYDGQAARIFNYSPFLLGTVLGEFAYYGRYSHRYERLALDAWQAHRLAPEVRRRLMPRYFVAPDTPRL